MNSVIWLGLDVHADFISIARLDGDSNKPVFDQIPNRPHFIRRKFKKLSELGTLRCCYEAGPTGFGLQRLLSSMDIQCEVIAPSLIPKKPGDRIKTDRRDAFKLARLYRAGELDSIYVPTEEQEAVRGLMRAREQVRRDRTAARHRLSKFLTGHGRRYTEGTNWTKRHRQWIGRQRFEQPADRIVFEHYVEQVDYLDATLERLEKEIMEYAQRPEYRQRVERLSCLRGISVLSAMVLLTELYDLRRFEHPRELMSYIGLVPREHSSGSRVRRGAITKTGNSHVRRILVESAWAYRKCHGVTRAQQRQLMQQPPLVAQVVRRATHRLSKRYNRLVGRGKPPQVAIVAVARELCGFIWELETMDTPLVEQGGLEGSN